MKADKVILIYNLSIFLFKFMTTFRNVQSHALLDLDINSISKIRLEIELLLISLTVKVGQF